VALHGEQPVGRQVEAPEARGVGERALARRVQPVVGQRQVLQARQQPGEAVVAEVQRDGEGRQLGEAGGAAAHRVRQAEADGGAAGEEEEEEEEQEEEEELSQQGAPGGGHDAGRQGPKPLPLSSR